MATRSVERPLTVDDFLRIDFDLTAELDDGAIRMLAGGSRAHDRVQLNLIVVLSTRLRGSGCRPSGSDMGVHTHDGSLRYPDVSVTCGRNGPADDAAHIVADPCVVVKISSPTTPPLDRGIKPHEYKALASVEAIVLIDPDAEPLRVVQRTGRDPDGRSDVSHARPPDLMLPRSTSSFPTPRSSRPTDRNPARSRAVHPAMTDRAHDPHVPANSVLFGYGPMLPLLIGGAAAWFAPGWWPVFAVRATVLWGALILVFLAGVRRGFGFGAQSASTPVEIATMLLYFLLALAALLVPDPAVSLGLLVAGYGLVAVLDPRAATMGDAPAHFARLRPPQMLVGIVGLLATLARTLA